MPRRKTAKRKVKEVVVPEGDEGSGLSKADRKAKLDSFLEQFKQDGRVSRACSIYWLVDDKY